MSWQTDFLPLAEWALRVQDLRHRYLYARSAKHVLRSTGIAFAYETMVSLSIFEAALGKGYVDGQSAWLEKPYPNASRLRADLAFKDSGAGKPWGYIEVKHVTERRRRLVQADIEKLRSISARSQRWLFLYGVYLGKTRSLKEMLESEFSEVLHKIESRSFETIGGINDSAATCELCLVRVK